MCVNVRRTFTCLPVFFVCFHLSYLVWEGGGCSFIPMLVNSDDWDGDHSSPGGGSCMMHLLLLLIVRVHLHKYCVLAVKPAFGGLHCYGALSTAL